MKEDAGTGDVTQLAGVILQWAVFGHTDLYGQVNFVPSGLSALSHNVPPELDARRRPRDLWRAALKTIRLRFGVGSRIGKANANSSHYRKYRHSLMKFAGEQLYCLGRRFCEAW